MKKTSQPSSAKDSEAQLNFWIYGMEMVGNLFRVDRKPEELEMIFVDTLMEIMRVQWIGFFAGAEKQGEFTLTHSKPVMADSKGLNILLTKEHLRQFEKEQTAVELPAPQKSSYYSVSQLISSQSWDQEISLMLPIIDAGLKGFLLLGTRELKKTYSPDELRYLKIVVKQFMQAHENLKLIDERETLQKTTLEQEQQQQVLSEKVEQMEQELRSLARLGGGTGTSITARLFGRAPLRESAPDIFNNLIVLYGEVMDLALEQRRFKVEHNIGEKLQPLAKQLGFLSAGPRDVIEIHSAAIKDKSKGVPTEKLQAYTEEGRLMILELMGYLASYYRNLSMGSSRKVMEKETP